MHLVEAWQQPTASRFPPRSHRCMCICPMRMLPPLIHLPPAPLIYLPRAQAVPPYSPAPPPGLSPQPLIHLSSVLTLSPFIYLPPLNTVVAYSSAPCPYCRLRSRPCRSTPSPS